MDPAGATAVKRLGEKQNEKGSSMCVYHYLKLVPLIVYH